MNELSKPTHSLSVRRQALSQLPDALRDVAQQVLAFLEPRLELSIDQTGDELFRRADSADSMDERKGWFEAGQTIRQSHRALMDGFTVEFLAGFRPSTGHSSRHGPEHPAGEFGGVEVLDGDAFELSVAVSTVTSRYASKHKAFMDRIAPALASAQGTMHSRRRNPLSVFRITGAFMTAVGQLRLDAAAQRILLDAFEREVIDGLGGIYGQVCRTLNIDASGVEEPSSEYETADGSAWPDEEAPGGHRGAEFGVLRNLIHGRAGAPGRSGPAGGSSRFAGGSVVSSAQLLDALAGFEAAADTSVSGEALNLHAMVDRALAHAGAERSQMEELAQDTLELVALLFEHILRDDDLSIPVLSLISRLQIPVLKVAIVDSSVFDDSDHVVRQVINRLADVGIGWWGDTDGVRQDPLYRDIDRVVGRIVDECHTNPDVFAEADAELARVVGRHGGRASKLEQRLGERESGKAKIHAARTVVQDLINTCASGLRLPDGLACFIREEWSQVLVYLCVRYGPDSREWQDAGATFAEMLSLGQPAGREQDVARRAERLPFLLERVEHWLHVAGFQSTQTEARLEGLYQAFRQLTVQDEAWFGGNSRYEVHELPEMEVVELVPPEAVAEALDPELQALVAALRPGAWMEISTDGEGSSRCKLSLVFEQSGNHLFVDHRGLRVCEMTAREVAEGIRDGRIRELKADPIVERALDDMITQLKDSILQDMAAS